MDKLAIKLLMNNVVCQFQVGIGELSTAREGAQASAVTCEEMGNHHQRQHPMAHHEHLHQQQQHHHAHHEIATTAFHVSSRPSHPISTIISPPPLHHTSIINFDRESYHISGIMLENENFQVLIHEATSLIPFISDIPQVI